MRFLGIIILFSLCVIAGISIGQIGKKKIMFFLEFKRVITLLKGEVRYGITPIGEACSHVSGKTEGVFKQFLLEISRQIEEKSKKSFAEIWEMAAVKRLPKEYFKENEWKQMIQIGSSIGYLDTAMQLKHFDLLLDQIERCLAAARLKQEKDGKLYQTLGIGLGLMMVIVLI
jgi:stage III sporulation protein AB